MSKETSPVKQTGTYTFKEAISMLWTAAYRVLHGIDQAARAVDEVATYAADEAEGFRMEGEVERTERLNNLREAVKSTSPQADEPALVAA